MVQLWGSAPVSREVWSWTGDCEKAEKLRDKSSNEDVHQLSAWLQEVSLKLKKIYIKLKGKVVHLWKHLLQGSPHRHIVGCQGVVQLGGADPWYYWGGSSKVGVAYFDQQTGAPHAVRWSQKQLFLSLGPM